MFSVLYRCLSVFGAYQKIAAIKCTYWRLEAFSKTTKLSSPTFQVFNHILNFVKPIYYT